MQNLRAKLWWRKNSEIPARGWEILNHLVYVGGEATIVYTVTLESLVEKKLIEPYIIVKQGNIKLARLKLTEKGYLTTEERAFLNGDF